MKRTIIFFGCVVMLAAASQAVEIRNSTTGTRLFYDDFENPAITPSTQNAYDGSVDADPIAKVGTWNAFERGDNAFPGLIQVTTSTTPPDPVPFNGGRDLRDYRKPLTNNSDLAAILISPQTTVGNLIHLSMRVYIPSSQNADFRGRFILAGSTVTTAGSGFNSARAWVDIKLGGFVHTIGPGFADTATTVPYLTDTWQEWSLDYVVGASTFNFSVAGVSGSGASVTSGDVYGAEFINGSDGPTAAGGGFYLDAPEPTSVALLALGGLMLWRARRRSRME